MSKLFVLSLGGSLIVPEEIDQKFLQQFRSLVLRYIKKGHRFVLVTGGGHTSRKYTAALEKLTKPRPGDLHWLGIQATWLNAKLVQLMFGKLAHPHIISDPNKKVKFKEKILVAGGWKPDRSTDDDAARLAKVYGSKLMVNFTNVDYVYDRDPRKFKNAKKIESISWQEYNKMFSAKWNPGAHAPLDPVAARFAQKNGQSVIIANGRDLKNLEKILKEQPFKGTLIN